MSEDIRVEFVGGPDTDPAELDGLAQALRAEILQLDEVDHVEQASAGPAPEGTRAIDLSAIGALVVGVTPGLAAVGKVVSVISHWLAARSSTPPLQMTIGDKSIVITPDKGQQDALVAAFVAALQDQGPVAAAEDDAKAASRPEE